MEFSFDVKSLTDPKKRLLLGILLLAVGVFCMIGPGRSSGVTREDCVTLMVTFDDCKYHSGDKGLDSNSIYLTFRDYSDHLDIHPSCADDKLTQDLMELRSGTKMQIVVSEETRHIYELSVDGEKWLNFDEAIKKIDKNMVMLKYFGYVAMAAGALFGLTGILPLLFEVLKRKESAREME